MTDTVIEIQDGPSIVVQTVQTVEVASVALSGGPYATVSGVETFTNKTIASAAFTGTQTGNFITSGILRVDSGGYAAAEIRKGADADDGVLTFSDGVGGVSWQMVNAATSNDCNLLRYIDGVYQDNPFSISNSTGKVTIANDLEVNGDTVTIDSSGDANIHLDVGASGDQGAFFFQTGGSNRWAFYKTSDLESGANAGSNLVISNYNDAGTYIGNVLNFNRATGYIDLPGCYTETTASAANVFVASDGSMRRSTSSLRYKINVEDMTYGLKDVLALRPVTYAPKPNGENEAELNKRYGGLIAEEVDAAGLKEFVGYNDEGQPDSLHYGQMVALCIKAIQELKAEIEQLKEQING